jgi:hypothetical protein
VMRVGGWVEVGRGNDSAELRQRFPGATILRSDQDPRDELRR